MKEIVPYSSTQDALESLDNGGRFYNLASKANDGQITSAELAKAAGVFIDKQNMILYLEMAFSELNADSQRRVISSLTPELSDVYTKYKPQWLLPSEAKEMGICTKAAIITGIPKLVDSKSEFNGFIIIPIITNNVTTFTMIPIIDQYDVYELRDEETGKDFIIAHSRAAKKLPGERMKCGGILKELKAENKEDATGNLFLEAVYFSLV